MTNQDTSPLDEKRAKANAVMKWALKSESRDRINAMVDLARSEPGIPIMPDELDRDAWLFNVPNGTLELRGTPRLREHRRDDMITKLCPIEFHPEARCDVWEAFLDEIFQQKTSLIRYIQKFFGYCLTGDVSEQILGIFWGTGANGKSTLVNTIMTMMGEDYAIKANRDLFVAKKADGHPAQLARLFGKRLVLCIESQAGACMDEVLVKELTGGDPIAARRMKEDWWQFNPTHKAVLVTNHKPKIVGTDEGIWRRQRLVPFTVEIPRKRRDKWFGERLMVELPGILAWCVRGCELWQAEGLQPPLEVIKATRQYRNEEDLLRVFLRDRCVLGANYRVKARIIYGSYRTWCEMGGEQPGTERDFGTAMTERGFERYRNDGVWYRGVAIAPPRAAGAGAPAAGAPAGAGGTNGTNGTNGT